MKDCAINAKLDTILLPIEKHASILLLFRLRSKIAKFIALLIMVNVKNVIKDPLRKQIDQPASYPPIPH